MPMGDMEFLGCAKNVRQMLYVCELKCDYLESQKHTMFWSLWEKAVMISFFLVEMTKMNGQFKRTLQSCP
jgi:hypothetical protein